MNTPNNIIRHVKRWITGWKIFPGTVYFPEDNGVNAFMKQISHKSGAFDWEDKQNLVLPFNVAQLSYVAERQVEFWKCFWYWVLQSEKKRGAYFK